MSTSKIIGNENAIATAARSEHGDREAMVIEIEGLYKDLKDSRASLIQEHCPSNYVVETNTLATTGEGFAKLTIRCVKYENGSSFEAERTTFHIDMVEVTYDLKDHPHLAEARSEILMWLATDESKRVTGDGDYKFENAAGSLQTVGELGTKFCDAYMAGIKTFNRYYPVIDKISIWKNPPGMNMSGRSFTGGSPSFSDDVGEYDSPPLSLNGFTGPHWFKSKDSWQENADSTWTRSEQWTYTPEASTGDHGWIYAEL